jgi:hypothetical protein
MAFVSIGVSVVQLSPVLAEFAISVRSGNKPVALLRPFVPCPLPRHGFDEVHNPRRSSVSGGSGSRAGSRVPRSSLCDVQRLTKPSGLGVVLCTLVGCRLIWARDPSRRPLGRASVEGPLPPCLPFNCFVLCSSFVEYLGYNILGLS